MIYISTTSDQVIQLVNYPITKTTDFGLIIQLVNSTDFRKNMKGKEKQWTIRILIRRAFEEGGGPQPFF